MTRFFLMANLRRFADMWFDIPTVELEKDILMDLSFNEYIDDYSDEIDGLFLDWKECDAIMRAYESVRDNYSLLSIEFKKISNVYGDIYNMLMRMEIYICSYLDAVKDLFKLYFEYDGCKRNVVNENILKQIVYSDIRLHNQDNKVTIGIGNPMVLETLLVCYYQRNHFAETIEVCSRDCESVDYEKELFKEIFIEKVLRLLRDVVILYDNEYYRIVDFDDNEGRFIAQTENSLPSIEVISATRLFEKIIKNYSELKHKDLINVVVIGETLDGSFDCLKEMLKTDYEKINIRQISNKEEIYRSLWKKSLSEIINENDKVFILDCPEIYLPISLRDEDDGQQVLSLLNCGIRDILNREDKYGRRDFFNHNAFSTIYYRVQSYLKDINRNNATKSRKINVQFLDYLKEFAETFPNYKEVYVYISNNRDFYDELYNKYNFTRVERYNSKECRIILFDNKFKKRKSGELSRLSRDIEKYSKVHCGQRKNCFNITLYKIIKMVSPFNKFHSLFSNEDKFLNSFKTMSNIPIRMFYSLYQDRIENHSITSVHIKFKYRVDKKECGLQSAIQMLLKKAFSFNSDNNVIPIVLLNCYWKAFGDILSGCSRNFDDLLLNHLYQSAINGRKDIVFDVGFENAIGEEEDTATDPELDEIIANYSCKQTAYYLMNTLDSDFYSRSIIIEQFRRAAINKDELMEYINELITSCSKIGYTNSNLYERLVEYY